MVVRTLWSNGDPPGGLKVLGNDLLARRAKMRHFAGKVRLMEGNARRNMGIALEQRQENLAREALAAIAVASNRRAGEAVAAVESIAEERHRTSQAELAGAARDAMTAQRDAFENAHAQQVGALKGQAHQGVQACCEAYQTQFQVVEVEAQRANQALAKEARSAQERCQELQQSLCGRVQEVEEARFA